jgi:hypothetical protein
MKKIFNSKLLKYFAGFSFALVGGLHITGHLDDARYLMGGMFRGLRCAKVGTQVALNYLNVLNSFNVEWNQPRNTRLCS